MNVFTQFIKSLHSPKHIAMFRFQGIGKTILYIFTLMLITLIPTSIIFSTGAMNMLKNFELSLQDENPDFRLANGILEADFDEPYIASVNGSYFIIDPKDKLSRQDIVAKYKQAVVLAQQEVLFIDHKQVNEFRYRNLGNINFSKEQVHGFVKSIIELLPLFLPLGLIFIYLVVTGFKFFGVTVLAAAGLVLIQIVKTHNINYRHLWIMSAYAATLPTTLFNLTDAFSIAIPGSFWLYWSIAITILYAALNAIPKRKKAE